jgi:protein TonB
MRDAFAGRAPRSIAVLAVSGPNSLGAKGAMTHLDPVLLRRAVRPSLSVLASLAIHLALVGGAVAVGVKAVTPSPPVLMAQLLAAKPPVPVEPPKARPAPPKPQPLVLPKPQPVPKLDIPSEPTPVATEPGPPPVVASPSPEPRPAQPPVPITPVPAAAAPVASPPGPPASDARRIASGTAPAAAPLPSGVSVVINEQSRPASGPTTASPGRPGGTEVAAIPPAAVQLAAPRGGYQVKPSYPAAARRLGVQGTTILRVFVAADGRVGDVAVEASAGHPDLDQAAAEAVRRWRFEPGRRGAEAIGMWVRLPVEFRLR